MLSEVIARHDIFSRGRRLWLERAYKERPEIHLRGYRAGFRPLRADAHFQHLMRRSRTLPLGREINYDRRANAVL
jgi:hypothetical protein